jgi:predicted permease
VSLRRTASRIYALAACAFPRGHRDDYAGEMVDAFERELETQIHARGRWRALRFVVAAWLDALSAGLGERRRQRFINDGRNQRHGGFRVRMSWLDVKLGFRMLARYPGLTVAAVLALAIAIGIGAGWYDLAGDMFRPKLPLPGGDRIVEVEMRNLTGSGDERRLLHDFLIWRQELRSIEDLGAYRTVERNLVLGDARPEPVTVAEITASAFQLARTAAVRGRTLVEADERPGAPPVVVLGYSVWQRRFGGREDAVGQTVQLGRARATVVGVMPEGFTFPISHRMWVPLQLQAAGYAPLEGVPIRVFGRLAPGATQAEAYAQATGITERIKASSPKTHEHLHPRVLAYGGESPGDQTWLELAITHLPILLVLVVACANVGTLIYARTATRDAEIGMRYALGASRGRIIGQLFVEALVLASVAAVIGLVGANAALRWGVAAFFSGQEGGMPFWMNPGLKLTTVLYAVGLTTVGAAILGVLPALKATGPRAQSQLRNAGAGGATLRFGAIWTTVMIAQVALTVICIVPAWGISEEAIRDRRIRSAFPAEEYLAVRMDLDREAQTLAGEEPAAAFAARRERTYREFERRIAQEPGVRAITYADRLPGMSPDVRTADVETSIGAEPLRIDNLWTAAVGPGFLEAFDVPIVAGRNFHDGDRAADVRTVLVNEAFARRFMDGASPVGRRVRYAGLDPAAPEPWFEIVGVTGDVGMTPTDFGEAPYMFRAASAATTSPLVMGVRSSTDPAVLAPRLRAIAANLDPGLRLDEVRTLDDMVWREDVPMVVGAGAITTIVALGLFLSAAGIFSLMSVSVARRTKEIGLRAALGATRGRLLAGIFSRALVLVGSGILAGNLVILLLVAVDGDVGLGFVWDALVTTSGVMLTVGLLACVEPARRALRIQPTEALKEA